MSVNYVLIGEITTNVATASVTFSNLPTSGYTDLKIVVSARSTANGGQNMNLTFNSNTSGYSDRILSGNGSAVSSFSSGNTARGGSCCMPGADFTANTFGNGEIYITNYRGSNPKLFMSDSVTENNTTTSFNQMQTTQWNNTDAISTILIDLSGGSFVAGSRFCVYGIANFGTTPTVLPKATGGDIVVNDGTYWYHAFLSSGVFTPLSNLTTDVLVVAGAGGGGVSYGGGGGGGGFQEFTSQALIATSYPCTVGAGGVGGSSATNGNNSQFGALTASVGGGFGGKNPPVNGNSGGSGGGGRGDNSAPGVGTGGAPTSGQGFAGGDGAITKSAGGGGAGSAGANGAAGGSNGWGKSSVITGGATTGLGVLFSGSYYLAAGGVGVGTITPTVANGGVAAYVVPPANSGTGSSEGTNAASGVVVIRYTMA
jgi:hypothetical protein